MNRLAGYERMSLVDWPGRVAAVLFLPGCNLSCWYCHNRRLVGGRPCSALGLQPIRPELSMETVVRDLRLRRGRLDGVVVTGGEATLFPRLVELLQKLRGLGLPIKLDTNGTNPRVLGRLLGEGLLDYVAMDIKSPPQRYAEVVDTPIRPERVRESLRLLRGEATPGERRVPAPWEGWEVRTTCVPELGLDDVTAMGQWAGWVPRWALQQYRALPLEERWLDPRHLATPHGPDWFAEAKDRLSHFSPQVSIRGIDTTQVTKLSSDFA